MAKGQRSGLSEKELLLDAADLCRRHADNLRRGHPNDPQYAPEYEDAADLIEKLAERTTDTKEE